jgi:hypothetical protein
MRTGAALPGSTVISIVRRIVGSSIRAGKFGQVHVRCPLHLEGRWPPMVVQESPGAFIDWTSRGRRAGDHDIQHGNSPPDNRFRAPCDWARGNVIVAARGIEVEVGKEMPDTS